METRYQQLKPEQRNRIQRGLNEGLSIRAVARQIGRSPSTVSRELRRGLVGESYDAVQGREEAQRRRRKGVRKLVEGAPLTNAVTHAILQRKWSPEQVAGRLRMDYPEDKQWHVSHETIYQFIYAHPVGDLRRVLVAALRRGHSKRKPHAREGPAWTTAKYAFYRGASSGGPGSRDTGPLGRRLHQGGFQRQRHWHPGGAQQPFCASGQVWKAPMPTRPWRASPGACAPCQNPSCIPSPMTRARRWRGWGSWSARWASASILPTRIVLGSAQPTRTPMVSCVSISPKERIYRDIRNGT